MFTVLSLSKFRFRKVPKSDTYYNIIGLNCDTTGYQLLLFITALLSMKESGKNVKVTIFSSNA